MNPTPRSVGRYRPGAAWLAGLSGLAATLGVLASPGNASLRPEPPEATGPARIGMNSCAARGCHGAVDATDPARGRVYIKDGAYTTWLRYDPHARAYAVLLETRSVEMARRLRGTLGAKPAHEAGLCLSCHATPGPPGPTGTEVAPASEGISCEGCHGPAEVWRDKHLATAWRAQSAERKALDGLVALDSPASRARSCVGCHVGDRLRGMDMNHDLIAAGHPRLNFEFASYLASYPKHWEEKPNPARSEAQTWAVGQVITARAVLDLLAARAVASKDGEASKPPAPEAIWPEFSEYECFACHHDLTTPSLWQKVGRPSGRLAWATWPSAELGELSRGLSPGPETFTGQSAWGQLRAEMARPVPDPDRVIDLASKGKIDLGALLTALEAKPFDPARAGALLKDLAARPPVAVDGWDRLAQHHLALLALARASKEVGVAIAPEVEAAIREGSKVLDFPPDYDSPRKRH